MYTCMLIFLTWHNVVPLLLSIDQRIGSLGTKIVVPSPILSVTVLLAAILVPFKDGLPVVVLLVVPPIVRILFLRRLWITALGTGVLTLAVLALAVLSLAVLTLAVLALVLGVLGRRGVVLALIAVVLALILVGLVVLGLREGLVLLGGGEGDEGEEEQSHGPGTRN